jgi:hypothetical protein
VSPDSRPEAAPDDVARWCEGVRTMPAEELATFERRIRATFQHHSLIDLIVAIHNRRERLERDGWYRVRPYRKPAGGFLAIGPRYRGDPREGRRSGFVTIRSRSGTRPCRPSTSRRIRSRAHPQRRWN